MNTLTTQPVSAAGDARVTRRLVLGGTAAGLIVGIAGCSGSSLPLISAPDPDDEVRLGVARSEQALVAAYDAAIAATPAAADQLRTFRDQHQAHFTAVSEGLDPAALTPASSPASASPGKSPTGLRGLRRMEVAAARQRIEACTAATAGDLAELLARIAASESGHAAALSGPVS